MADGDAKNGRRTTAAGGTPDLPAPSTPSLHNTDAKDIVARSGAG